MRSVSNILRASLFALSAFFAVASAVGATVERVIVRQQWPWHDSIKVEYKLSDVSAPVDIAVSLTFAGETVEAVPSAFSGALYAIPSAGVYFFTIDPAKTGLSSVSRSGELTVSLSPVSASEASMFALYKIFDLETGECEDVTAGAIASGFMGSWHFADANAACLAAGVSVPAALTNIVWTGVNSNIVYKTKKLAMRYLHAKTAIVNLLNRADKPGSIGHDYYIGVYEVTQKQWELVAGSPAQCSWVSDLKPVNTVSYDSIRGADTTNYWSAMMGGNAPHPDSFLGKLRTRTGGVAFDLPTRAMHEYATQANSLWRFANDGNSTSGSKNGAWNDDSPFKNIPISAAAIDPNLPGTYAGNAGYKVGPSQVGSFACNKVGLFDTIGNVREWCVDWHDADMKQSNYTELKGAANVDPQDYSLIWKNNKDEKRGSMRYCAGTTYMSSLITGITPNYFNGKEAGLAPDGISPDTGLRLVIVVGE